jgi:hypothetical protein
VPVYAGLTPVTSPSDPAVVVAWREDVGTINATWTDPTGVVWPLSDTSPDRGWFTSDGVGGWGAAPYEIVVDPMARGGESVRYIRANPARVTWPIYVWGDDHTEFVARYRALRQAFLMTVHRSLPGLLTVARPDGTARQIEAYYEDGWGGEAGQNWLWAHPAVTLYCPDGAWRDVQQVVTRRGASTPVAFNTPFLTLTGSAVLGDTVVNNPGDITAWPVWTITGPCTGLIATNSTTGQTFTLSYALLAGEQAVITTDRPTVRGPAGQNISGSLNWPTAYLWGLAPGDNTVTFNVLGSGVGSAIDLAFYPRYEGA